MQIKLYTDSSQALSSGIFNAVENETIKTWVVRKDKDGTKYLTHKPEQWYDKALFSFKAEMINWLSC